ncbi:MAG TPA: F0F1 ATP synthase subunit A [Actinomycetota bacterium]
MFGLANLQGLLPVLVARAGFKDSIPSVNELYQWPCIWHIGGTTLCINRVVILEFVAAALAALVFILAFRRPRIVPRGGQNAMEALYDFVASDVVEGVIGRREGAVWQPYLSILFLFALIISFFEVIPVIQFPVSSRIAIPLILATGSWLVYNYAGIKKKGFFGYFKAVMFPPGVPKPAYVLLTPIELITALILRPATLAIRLFANFFAGHVLLTVFFVATAYLVALPATIPLAIPALVLSIFLVGLEIFIAAVQAYVFTLLTAVYITLSVSEEH